MRIYRATLLRILDQKELTKALKPIVRRKKWNVYIEHAGNGEKILLYLSNYVFRVAITNNNIVALNEDKVTFRFKKQKSDEYIYQTIDVFKFMKLFLLHILPSGYLKIRHFGFLSNRYRKENIQKIRQQLDHQRTDLKVALKIEQIKQKRQLSERRCPTCKGKITFQKINFISIRFHPLYPLAWKKRNPP